MFIRIKLCQIAYILTLYFRSFLINPPVSKIIKHSHLKVDTLRTSSQADDQLPVPCGEREQEGRVAVRVPRAH